MSFKGLDLGETISPYTLAAGPHGHLRGASVVAADGRVKCRRFLQIPYAHPPTGSRRWRPPQALADDVSWEDVDASEFGNITAQPTYNIRSPSGAVFPTWVQGRTVSEDALTVNIWTPAGEPPEGGWPVYVYLHGGWLQIGNPAMTDKNNGADLLDEAGVKVVIVAVAYRLSLFGFLASKEIQEENPDGCAGNFGFMDQRLGLEWTSKHIQYFGGNPNNITLGGPSAGSYSTQFQLCLEFNFPVKPLIKRVIMYSNAIPAQPKSVSESQAAFDGLLEAFKIPLSLDSKEKMARLRKVSTQDLMDTIMKLKIHTFRAVSDGAFVHNDTMDRIRDGDFARKFKERDMALIIGEVEQEELLYGITNPPDSVAALSVQLNNYYRSSQVAKIEAMYKAPSEGSINNDEDLAKLQSLYGEMVADGQVYVPSRGLVQTLFDNGVGMDRILRYRISWRPQGTDRIALFKSQVTHSDDTWAWWYSKRYGFEENDCQVAQEWLRPVKSFFAGGIEEAAQLWWGTSGIPTCPQKQRALMPTSKVDTIDDDRWERCLKIAEAVKV